MESIDERAKLLIKSVGIDTLVRCSDIGHSRWKNVLYKSVRMSTKELEVLKDICPAYAYWLISGEIQPECGHSSPEWERHEGIKIKKQLEKKTDPLNCEMCGKTITAEESALTMEKPLGARENRFLIVCHRCNVRQGKR